MQLQIAAATWRIETKSDFMFYQITLVLTNFATYKLTGVGGVGGVMVGRRIYYQEVVGSIPSRSFLSG